MPFFRTKLSKKLKNESEVAPINTEMIAMSESNEKSPFLDRLRRKKQKNIYQGREDPEQYSSTESFKSIKSITSLNNKQKNIIRLNKSRHFWICLSPSIITFTFFLIHLVIGVPNKICFITNSILLAYSIFYMARTFMTKNFRRIGSEGLILIFIIMVTNVILNSWYSRTVYQ